MKWFTNQPIIGKIVIITVTVVIIIALFSAI